MKSVDLPRGRRKIAAMSSKVTMSDIAQALDVSAVTVSRALAGKDGVGGAMREKILQKAVESTGICGTISKCVSPP